MDLSPLLPGLGTALLAIISGAGGSALLELYYKPRRKRRRAAALLFAENILNAQLILLQAEVRKKQPRAIPEDFRLSTLAWDASQDAIQELPTELLKRIVILYNRFESLNAYVDQFATTYRKLENTQSGTEAAKEMRRELNVIIDVFNTGLDAAHEDCLEVLRQLKDLGDIDESEPDEDTGLDFEERVERLKQERAIRLEKLEQMDQEKQGGPESEE